ncbi:MAG: hypothetical protein IKJ80_00345 [Clostridia bacterium]|nr:hypothetical protein [Clostridia bacterium]
MSSISVIPVLIATLIILCVAYYFLYYNYINKRLADKCKKRRLPHPTITALCFVLLFSIIFNAIFYAELNKTNEKCSSLQVENNNYSKALHIAKIDTNSPYWCYKDIITSGDSHGYKVTQSESNDFRFYFGHSECKDDAVYYPQYICYIEYDGILTADSDVTIEYVYDKNNSYSTSGEFEREILLLSRYLERLPKEINITIRERGSKLEEGDIIANVSFTIYSI